MVLKRLPYSIIFLLIFLAGTVSAQSYFRVVEGIPHLPVMAPAAIPVPETGMLIYSSTDGKPMLYTGQAWESLCTTNIGQVGKERYFAVKNGIFFLPVLDAAPVNSGKQGAVYYAVTGKATMIHNGSEWVKIQDIHKYAFAENNAFSAGTETGAFRLPVLNQDPASAKLEKGAFYLNAASRTIRYYDGGVWLDLRCGADITTLAVTAIKGSSATGSGEVLNTGGALINTVGICWSTNANPDADLPTKTSTAVTGSGLGVFSGDMTDLMPNTVYHVRAYAITSLGTVYGEDRMFRTTVDLPGIITLPVSSITSMDALSGGDISSDGGSPVTSRGIRWSVKGDPIDDPAAVITNDGSGVGTFPSSMNGLLGNTTYYVRAYAVNSAGTAYGNLLQFTTPPPVLPVLSSATSTVTEITHQSAIGTVNIISNGGALVTKKGFAWSIDKQNWTFVASSTVNPSDIGLFMAQMTGLEPGTTYYAKGYATNIAGTAYTSETSFVTSSLAVIVTTKPFNIAGLTAYSGGQISHNGGSPIIKRGVVWSTSEWPTVSLPTKTEQAVSGEGTGSYAHMITGLTTGTKYYVRAYAISEAGTSYGNQESFTTVNYATVATLSASSFYNNTANGGGQVLSDGGSPVTSRGVCWSASPNPTVADSRVFNGSGTGVFTVKLTSLLPNTTYHMRAFATNAVGTAYGEDKTFILLSGLPSVETLAVTNISNIAATGGGNVTDNGGADITHRGIRWSAKGDPVDDTAAGFTDNGTGTGTFQDNMNPLLGNTTYYVRAYATNQFGTAYGDMLQFITVDPLPPVLASLTLKMTDITDTKASGTVNILSNGGAPIVSRGIAYSLDQLKYEYFEFSARNQTDIGIFGGTITGLLPGTTYYAKGYATNSAGTTFTDETTFTTPVLINVTTTAVSMIGSTTAQSGGKILDPGNVGVILRGVCWNTTGSPTISDAFSTDGAGTGTFTSFMQGLNGSTRYYVRAYATYATGTVYGDQEQFITAPPIVATVSTTGVNDIGGRTAIGVGKVTDDGGTAVTSRGFCWNTAGNPIITDAQVESGTGKGTFFNTLTGLSPLTKYYIRAYAVNAVGIAYGEELSFTTATLATLTTAPITAIQYDKATSGGEILNDGGAPVTQSGICWNISGLPTTADQHTISGTGIGTFIHDLNNLLGNTVYYVRAYAINSAGTAYGNVQTFTTAPPVLASLKTLPGRSGNNGTTGYSGGQITSTGGALLLKHGLVWSTVPGFNPEDGANSRIVRDGAGDFSIMMTGLVPGTTYYVRAFVVNQVGTSYAVNEERFSTFSLPQVITAAIPVTAVTNTSATGGGTITADGGSAVLNSGLCWSTSALPDLNGDHTTNAVGMGSFTNIISGLMGSTTYYVRAYATSEVGTAYGDVVRFTTLPPELATLTTREVQATSATTANGGGMILSNGGAQVTTRGLQWSLNPDFNPADQTAETGYFTGDFNAKLSGLTNNTVYYVRAYAVNTVGTAYGNIVSFKTPQLPVLSTTYASATGSTTARSGGDITDEGGAVVMARGVVWSTSPDFKPEEETQNRTNNGSRGGAFASLLNNLKASTTYYIRAYATNVAGTAYGNLLSFITDPPSLAKLITRDPYAITGTTAISGGIINDNGGEEVTTRGLVWSTVQGFRPEDVTVNKTAQTGVGNASFVSTMTNLVPGTTYYVRAYAINKVGIAYGNELRFTTLIIPVLSTRTVSVASQGTTAGSGGTIISDGGSRVNNQGVVWSTAPNPTIGLFTKTTRDPLNGNTFLSTITGLEPVTTYYVRAYATNSEGTGYGEELTFTTPPVLPVLTTNYITPTSKSSATTGGNVSKDGGAAVTKRGVVWSTDRSFNPDNELTNRTSDGTGTGTFTSNITGLSLSTAYYVRAYATNSVGTAYGNQVTVTLFPTAPVLITKDITNVGGFSAQSGGEITSDGGADVTLKGLCWSTHTNPTIDDSRTANGSGMDSFNATMTGLKPNTLYYVRAYAVNKIGVAYGLEKTVLTDAFPTLTATLPVTNILATTASSGGEITDDGRSSITARGVTWNTAGNPVIGQSAQTTDNISTGIGKFVADMKNLVPNTTYYVRAYATNGVGTTYGSQVSFTTLTVTLPTLQTAPVTLISSNGATSGGEVLNDGGMPVTQRGICWSTLPAPTTALATRLAYRTGGTGIYDISFTGLQPGTKYYVRAYAINSQGTAYGQEETFVTAAIAPSVSVVTLSKPTMTSLDGTASVINNGGADITDRGFYWNTTGKAPVLPLDESSLLPLGAGGPAITGTIGGLTTNTRYYVWAYAKNSAGTGISASAASYVTPGLPAITTSKPVSVFQTSATLGGVVTNDGGMTVTQRGVCWSLIENPTTDLTTKILNGTGTGAFSNVITGLVKGTKYYVRAFATNSLGTSYGLQESFTTLDLPGVVTSPVTAIASTSATGGGEVMEDGGAAITSRGVVWSINPDPTVQLTTKTVDGKGIGAFTSNITGLTLATKYYIRAYAINSVGTMYGNLETFTTPAIPPKVGVVKITNTTDADAEGTAEVLDDGKAEVTARGLVWSTTKNMPTLDDNKLTDSEGGLGSFMLLLQNLADGPTYYVRAYATNNAGTGYSTVATSFKICKPVSIIHKTGLNGAPTDKAITYKTTNSNLSGSSKCWITQNLGAEQQASAVNDTNPAAAGWYFQFNRSQGYENNTARVPADNAWTLWNAGIGENSDWSAANDPCVLLLGGGWRLPTYSEWFAADGAPQNWSKDVDAFGSELKLHNAGYLTNDKGLLAGRGTAGRYWSIAQYSNTSYGWSLNLTPTTSAVEATFKSFAYSVRCLRDDAVLAKPLVSNVSIPVSGMTTGTAEGTATVAADGGAKVVERGLVWSTSNVTPTLADNILKSGSGVGEFKATMIDLTEGPTYYVRAYATNQLGTAYSPKVTSFKICNPFTMIHKAGLNGAPTDKNITYKTISTNISGAPRCWLAQNLGADQQAGNLNDASETASGWYFQFNRSQGYEYTDARNPADNGWRRWNAGIGENSDWYTTNDPCMLLLGGGWRLPSYTEWLTADAPPQNWTKDTDAFGSELKLHNAGFLSNDKGIMASKGTAGRYWSSAQYSNTSYGWSMNLSATTSVVDISLKSSAYPVRCIRDAVTVSKAIVSNVSVPTSDMDVSSAKGSAVVTSDGGATITERGLVWSDTNKIPTITDYKVVDGQNGVGPFTGLMPGLIEGPTYYVRAYAINEKGVAYSPDVTSFKICNPFTMIHKAGLNGAPVDKTVTYKTISSNLSGTAKCWITQNLGAEQQASAVNDVNPAAAGWYFQFNRIQGYENNTSRVPADNVWTPWNAGIAENSDWSAANDPCSLLLGGGWRLPAYSEWLAVDAPPQDWGKDVEAFGSELKLHDAGYLTNDKGLLAARGTSGRYWSTAQYSNTSYGWSLNLTPATSVVDATFKSFAYSVRCIRDGVIVAKPVVSVVSVPTSGMTANSAEGTVMVASDGGAAVTDRGLVWSTTNVTPTLGDNILKSGSGIGEFKATMTDLIEGPTYYVRAYATNQQGTSYSPQVTSFKICNPFTMIHKAGLNGAPTDKTVTYKTISTNISGAPRCWITQNLGADQQAGSVNDVAVNTSGWYFQFNRSQGYEYSDARNPADNGWRRWNAGIGENSDWYTTNDPCILLLGGGWRLPSYTEWLTADAPPQNWTKDTDAFGSELKLHNAGFLSNDKGIIASKGTAGRYWSSAQYSNTSYGWSMNLSATTSVVDISLKSSAYPVRCIRDAVTISKAIISNVSMPTSDMDVSSAKGSAVVTSNGGAVITERGFVWSDTNKIPTVADNKLTDDKIDTGVFKLTLKNLVESPTYYVRAYVINEKGVAYSPDVTSFKICNPFTMIHKAGLNGAPTDKTVTYKTVSSNISGTSKCWITQNLGADQQAGTVDDTNPGAAGWYFQFNRAQGYENNTSRVPADNAWTPWNTGIAENSDWSAANDPCNLLLGGGWRLPVYSEWVAADAPPQDWGKDVEAFGSELKLHDAGYLTNDKGVIAGRGTAGRYWSSAQYSNTSYAWALNLTPATSVVDATFKSFAYPVRCIRDLVVLAKPLVSVVSMPTSGMTVNSAEGTVMVASDGGSPVTERGLVWSTTSTTPALGDNVLRGGSGIGEFKLTMAGLAEGPTYYVRAYATNKSGTTYSQQVTSFKICNPFTVNHKVGVSGAPADKTITYNTISTNISGVSRCWLTQNLGAEQQAVSVTDGTAAAAGWYWQFNRSQGYDFGSVRVPATAPWNAGIGENSDWSAANDPCNLLLSGGWRLPTYSEWLAADAAPQFWTKDIEAYASELKLHDAGYLSNDKGILTGRGTAGRYWSVSQYSNTSYGWSLNLTPATSVVDISLKSFAYPVRCIRN